MIHVENICKTFCKVQALGDVCLDVGKFELF